MESYFSKKISTREFITFFYYRTLQTIVTKNNHAVSKHDISKVIRFLGLKQD